MKKFIKILLGISALLLLGIFLLSKFFFQSDKNIQPEITELPESQFEYKSEKPFFYSVDKQLYYSEDGYLSYSKQPILRQEVEEAFISPDGKHALLYYNNNLTLINSNGIIKFRIDNCTDMIATDTDRKSGRFISSEIQWSKNSDFFLVSQDRVWDKNFSNKNKSSIYKYTISDNSFKPFLHLTEELVGSFTLSQNGKSFYYEFATSKGDLAFKKVDLKSRRVVSKHFSDDSLRLNGIGADSIFFNYVKFKEVFQGNSYDLNSIVTTARTNGVELYYDRKDTTVSLLSGSAGYGAFKGHTYDYFRYGYFLPGNKYFIANISSKNFNGQLIVDTKTFQVMSLKKQTEFYFNINSSDCNDFVFRYEIEPNVRYATSVSLEIESGKYK